MYVMCVCVCGCGWGLRCCCWVGWIEKWAVTVDTIPYHTHYHSVLNGNFVSVFRQSVFTFRSLSPPALSS